MVGRHAVSLRKQGNAAQCTPEVPCAHEDTKYRASKTEFRLLEPRSEKLRLEHMLQWLDRAARNLCKERPRPMPAHGAAKEAHRVVLGVEEHHHVFFTLEGIQRDLRTVLILDGEGWRVRADLPSSSSSLFLFVF